MFHYSCCLQSRILSKNFFQTTHGYPRFFNVGNKFGFQLVIVFTFTFSAKSNSVLEAGNLKKIKSYENKNNQHENLVLHTRYVCPQNWFLLLLPNRTKIYIIFYIYPVPKIKTTKLVPKKNKKHTQSIIS